MEQWFVINKKADFKGIGEQFQIDQVTARVIRNRDVVETEEIRQFLYGSLEDLNDPRQLKDGVRLAEILVGKIEEKKSIRIIGDYDIDGVMSTYILRSALERCGALVSAQIPERVRDGYGLNQNLIQSALEDGIDTILTCDNGIAAIPEIAFAKEQGLTVLVTDHHEIPYQEEDGQRVFLKSEADAVVNPHQKECPYPYKNLCGAAVAWKVVCILFELCGQPREAALEYLENVAFATVGDVMDLTGENRILVKEGLKRIHHTKNVGMRALIAQSGLETGQIDAFHFGFVLGPCINASGRLDTARRSLELFFETDESSATETANELVVLNGQRKELTALGVEAARQICESQEYQRDSVLVIFLPEVHESIAGIIAGRIRELYYKPVFILTRGEEGVKGSGRSIEEYSMYEEMCKCQELFTKFGGHPMAAGLSLPEENVELFRSKINEFSSLQPSDLIPKVKIDVPMPVDYVQKALVREFGILAPFGKGNPKPVFADKGLSIIRMWVIGKNQNVLRFQLRSSRGMPVAAIYFGDIEGFQQKVMEVYGADQLELAFHGKENRIRLSMVYYPRINSYRGDETLQFEVQHYQIGG